MASCVAVAEAGLYPSFKINGVAGGTLIVPTDTRNNTTACDYMLLTPSEFENMQTQLAAISSGSSGAGGVGTCANPFSLSAEDGALLSASIVGCWAAAYFIRSIINVVKNGIES